MQKVSIGRIVHIKGRNQSYPAIVTDVSDGTEMISAIVFTARGTSPSAFPQGTGAGIFTQVSAVTFAAILVPRGDEVGQWRFPPRVA